jgi:putative heme-binding domain-containing protein
MRFPPVILAAAFGFASLAAAQDTRLVRETQPLTPEQERAALHVPEGFEVQLFACEPMINKPINMGFDVRGRLWVSSTVEYPYSAAKERWSDALGTRVQDSRDAIKILEDTDGDGRADRVTDFADGLNIPTGVLPWHRPEHRAGCIAWSIPNIWYFGDSDGDDKADVREVLFGPLGYEKDTHGMCSSFRLGLDGWVYATHGFNNTSHLKAKDGSTLDLHSGNVFRFRPDGSRVEIWSWGQVNPFGLCFDRWHNLYSADCHSAPIYQLLRGAHYPSFGKSHDGLGFGPAMCTHTHGSTGICGIVYIDGGVWGPEWDDHMFVGNVVTSRINHDRITFTGATPKANEAPDFVTSEDPWFRPVDLQLGPDNALYIADFYNRIIGHYEVPLDHPGRDKERGRIWRVVKKGAGRMPRVIANPEWEATPEANLVALKQDNPFERRRAVERVTAAPQMTALPLLLRLHDETDEGDSQLRHGIKLALRENLKLTGAFASVPESSRQLAAEVALAVPTAEAAAYLWVSSGSSLSLAVLRHIARHGTPELLAIVAGVAEEKTRASVSDAVAALTGLHEGLSERGMPPPAPLLAWARGLADRLLVKLGEAPQPSWAPAVQSAPQPVWTLAPRKCADGAETDVLQSMKRGGADERLTGTLRSKAFPIPEKLNLWICGHRGFPKETAHDKNFVRLVDAASNEVLASAFPPRSDVCQPVAWDLGKHAGREARLEIVDGDNGGAYAWLGIARIHPAVVSVKDFAADDGTRAALRSLAQILQHTAPAALRERLAPYLPARPAPPPLAVSEEQRRQADALITARVTAFEKATPDAARGAQIFATHCAACHQIGGEGGLIGPQLDGIGLRGVARLCEDILDPNRNVDAHFHLHSLKLKDGGTASGFLKGEAGQVVILADAAGAEHRVLKADVLADDVLPLSLMPPVFGQTIPEKEFLDLLAWLLKK